MASNSGCLACRKSSSFHLPHETEQEIWNVMKLVIFLTSQTCLLNCNEAVLGWSRAERGRGWEVAGRKAVWYLNGYSPKCWIKWVDCRHLFQSSLWSINASERLSTYTHFYLNRFSPSYFSKVLNWWVYSSGQSSGLQGQMSSIFLGLWCFPWFSTSKLNKWLVKRSLLYLMTEWGDN